MSKIQTCLKISFYFSVVMFVGASVVMHLGDSYDPRLYLLTVALAFPGILIKEPPYFRILSALVASYAFLNWAIF